MVIRYIATCHQLNSVGDYRSKSLFIQRDISIVLQEQAERFVSSKWCIWIVIVVGDNIFQRQMNTVKHYKYMTTPMGLTVLILMVAGVIGGIYLGFHLGIEYLVPFMAQFAS